MFPDRKRMKLEMNNRKKTEKTRKYVEFKLHISKITRVKAENKREITKYFEIGPRHLRL